MLRGEFEKLLQILRPESFMDKNDLQVLKDKVFGPQVFFVTETRLTDDFSPDAGWLVSLLPWSLNPTLFSRHLSGEAPGVAPMLFCDSVCWGSCLAWKTVSNVLQSNQKFPLATHCY